jgi:maltose alpha-D-glucosyltransferase/alpha-amylase
MTKRQQHLSLDPLWYKDAIIYQLHIKSFFDANDDGVGDFAGLTAKLDYLVELGVDTVWVLPFYPSPRRDDGYDISEYRDVHTDYGKIADLKRFVRAAHQRGLKVITELVINHTSDQHPWFQRARRAKEGSIHRRYYVWSKDDHAYAGTRIIFVDTEKSNWTWDHEAGAYFWHRFYSHQPDLNFDNPRVLKEVLSVMRFWLDIGIDGLRLDAVPYLVEREGTNNENLPETHAILKLIRKELDSRYQSKMLLAEANQWPEDAAQYFGDGDECNMAFHFPLMPRIYMAIAQEDRFPISDILRQTPQLPENCQWAVFLRNHDELTLEMVTDKERDYLWETYATDRRARLNLGIRRRLAPLVEHDRRRIELMNGLLLSMPGTPVLYYGDEIGMGDNIHLGDRDGVRTPMQWSPDRNGGFSKADPAQLVLPPIMDALYGFQAVNVEAQKSDPHSLLNWMRRMLSVRRLEKAFGRGDFKLLQPGNRKILAYLRSFEDALILCVSNLSRTAQAVELDLADLAGRVPVDLVGSTSFPPIGQLPYLLTLPPYGFYWFRLATQAELPKWHKPAPEPLPELTTLVVRKQLAELLAEPLRGMLEKDILPAYLAKRRWFSLKENAKPKVEISYVQSLSDGDHPLVLSEITVQVGKQQGRYQIPLAVLWEDEIKTALPQQLALARIRIGRRVGILTDALSVDHFAGSLIQRLSEDARLPGDAGEIQFIATPGADLTLGPDDLSVHYLSAEQSNSTVIANAKIMLKLLRRVESGIHPEAEIGRYLAKTGFSKTAPLLGEINRVDADGARHTLALAFGFIRNQGDGWTWTLDFLSRWLADAAAAGASSDATRAPDLLSPYDAFATGIGRALGELHLALSQKTSDKDFAPEPVTKADLATWQAQGRETLQTAFDLLASVRGSLPSIEDTIAQAMDLRPKAEAAMEAVTSLHITAPKQRIHGDFHLGQVLAAPANVYIIDFEGEPAKPLSERREKTSPLRDVAGIMRSFDYAMAATMEGKVDTLPQQDESRLDLLKLFRQHAMTAFRKTYDDIQQAAEHPLLSTRDDELLLKMYLIEKAAYEITYELRNRPTWLIYPLRGLIDLLAEDDAVLPGKQNA